MDGGDEEARRRLYVCKLPLDIEGGEVEHVFGTYGKVQECKLMTRVVDGEELRAAFVTYEEEDAAKDAIQVLDGVYKFREDSSRPIRVSIANPRSGRGDRDKGSSWDGRESRDGRDSGWDSGYGGGDHRGGKGSWNNGWDGKDKGSRDSGWDSKWDSGKGKGGGHYDSRSSGGKGDDRGYSHSYDRGYDHGGYDHRGGYPPPPSHDRGYDYRGAQPPPPSHDRGYDDRGGHPPPPSHDRVSDRGYGSYDRPGPYDRGGQDRGYGRPAPERGYGHSAPDRGYGHSVPERGYGNAGPSDRHDHDRGGGSRDYDDRRSHQDDKGSESKKLYVANLPEDITKDALEYVFKNYGRIEEIHIMHGRSKTGQAGAFILYLSEREAAVAVDAMQGGYEIRPGQGDILVKFANSSHGSGGKSGRY